MSTTFLQNIFYKNWNIFDTSLYPEHRIFDRDK